MWKVGSENVQDAFQSEVEASVGFLKQCRQLKRKASDINEVINPKRVHLTFDAPATTESE